MKVDLTPPAMTLVQGLLIKEYSEAMQKEHAELKIIAFEQGLEAAREHELKLRSSQFHRVGIIWEAIKSLDDAFKEQKTKLTGGK